MTIAKQVLQKKDITSRVAMADKLANNKAKGRYKVWYFPDGSTLTETQIRLFYP